MKTAWDYTTLAQSYLKRPDYAPSALEDIFRIAGLRADDLVCDIGAGVAHLTLPLVRFGCRVDAVEPNDAMRALGTRRTADFPAVSWYEGTGEHTGRPGGYMTSSPSVPPSTSATGPPPLPRPTACSSPASGSSASGTTGICGIPSSRASRTSSGRPSPNTATARAARIRPRSSALPACSRTSLPCRARWNMPRARRRSWRHGAPIPRCTGRRATSSRPS